VVAAEIPQSGEHVQAPGRPGLLPEPDQVELAGFNVAAEPVEALTLPLGVLARAAVGVAVDVDQARLVSLDEAAPLAFLVVDGLLPDRPVLVLSLLGYPAVEGHAQVAQVAGIVPFLRRWSPRQGRLHGRRQVGHQKWIPPKE
jgi:hypothetical protein